MLCGRAMITKALSGEIGFKEYLEKVDGFCKDGLIAGMKANTRMKLNALKLLKVFMQFV